MSKETHDFVTYKVPGIPNGTVLEYAETESIFHFTARHVDELGVQHTVELPLSPAVMGAFVRTVKRKEVA